MVEMMLNWLVNNWDKFCLWVNNQPTFVEVAFGVGLFYLALQLAKALYRLILFLISGLFSTAGRIKKQRDMRTTPTPPRKRPATLDDEAPPFVFR